MLGHLIYNYQHLDDCHIQQEISKKLYSKVFEDVFLVHAYNGKSSFGYQKYLEDQLIRIKNRGHFQGAADLINVGLNFLANNKKPGLKYVLVTAADTWLLKTEFLQKIIKEMERSGQVLAASSWGRARPEDKPTGLSTDFFIIDIEWNRKAKLFPLQYGQFAKKFADIFYFMWAQPTVEAALQYNFMKYFGDKYQDNERWRRRDQAFQRIVEREPIHQRRKRKSDWPTLGLYTDSENPRTKQKILKKLNYNLGPHSGKLIEAKSLDYYNQIG